MAAAAAPRLLTPPWRRYPLAHLAAIASPVGRVEGGRVHVVATISSDSSGCYPPVAVVLCPDRFVPPGKCHRLFLSGASSGVGPADPGPDPSFIPDSYHVRFEGGCPGGGVVAFQLVGSVNRQRLLRGAGAYHAVAVVELPAVEVSRPPVEFYLA